MKVIQNLTVGGTGVFAGNVSVPNGTSPAHAVNKSQLDASAGGTAMGATVVGGTVGNVPFIGAGTVFAQSPNLFWDETNNRLGIGTNAPTHGLHVKKTGYTPTYIAPGDICSVLMENGEANGKKSKLSIGHAYDPSNACDIYSLVVDAGYDLPGLPYSQCSLGVGTFSGPGQTGLFLKGLGLYFLNTNCSIIEANYPTNQSIRIQLFNPTATYYVGTQGNEISLGVNATQGVYVRCDTDTNTLFQSSISLGGTRLMPRTSSDIALVVRGLAAQTAPLLQIQNSAGISLGNVGGTIFNNFTDVSSTGTNGSEDDLYSYSIPANILSINGDSLFQKEHVQFVSSATASRRLKKYFGGTLIFDSGALTLTVGGDFVIETTVIRESSTVVRASVNVVTTSASSVPYATYTRITSLTLSGTNILKTTGIAAGTGAASGDIVERLSKVKFEPAA